MVDFGYLPQQYDSAFLYQHGMTKKNILTKYQMILWQLGRWAPQQELLNDVCQTFDVMLLSTLKIRPNKSS